MAQSLRRLADCPPGRRCGSSAMVGFGRCKTADPRPAGARPAPTTRGDGSAAPAHDGARPLGGQRVDRGFPGLEQCAARIRSMVRNRGLGDDIHSSRHAAAKQSSTAFLPNIPGAFLYGAPMRCATYLRALSRRQTPGAPTTSCAGVSRGHPREPAKGTRPRAVPPIRRSAIVRASARDPVGPNARLAALSPTERTDIAIAASTHVSKKPRPAFPI